MLGLMQQRIQENYKHEEECQGLIIVEAYYGKEEHIRELVRSVNRALYHLSHEVISNCFMVFSWKWLT